MAREAKLYNKDNINYYNCDIRIADNLEHIYDARRDWVNGKYNYNKLLTKEEIFPLLEKNLVAIEGLEEINEEDLNNL